MTNDECLQKLPDNCLHYIATKLKNNDLLSYLLTCKTLSDISSSTIVKWSLFIVRYKKDDYESWLQICAEKNYGDDIYMKILNTLYTNDSELKSKTILKALELSIQYGYINSSDYLIKNYPDILGKWNKQETPLHLAIKHKRLNIALYLINENLYDRNVVTQKQREHILHTAVRNQDVNIVKKLLSIIDLKLNIKNVKGETPFQLALNLGLYKIVNYFIQSDTKIKIEPYSTIKNQRVQFTILHQACVDKNIECVKALLNAKTKINIDINAKTKYGFTPLYFCVKEKNVELVEFLCSLPEVQSNLSKEEGEHLIAIIKDEMLSLKQNKSYISKVPQKEQLCLYSQHQCRPFRQTGWSRESESEVKKLNRILEEIKYTMFQRNQ